MNQREGGDGGLIKSANSPYCRLKSVDLGAVTLLPGFWGDGFRQCAEVTLPHLYRLMADPEQGHALTNLRIAAGLETGEFKGTHWQDEWVYKWLEAASYVYGATGDAQLDRQMDDIIAVVARAQQPDGYIATQITVRGWSRFQQRGHHELYVMGHLFTAACAHHRATAKTNLLDVARKAADYLYETFMPRDPVLDHIQNNTSQIMGLVELYRTTGDRRYLDLANVFVDMHGSPPGGTDQHQDRVPLRQEQEVVGHAVFFTYLYAGAADAYMETGDPTLLAALDRLWHDLTERKLYVQGGVCAVHRGLSVRSLPGQSQVGGANPPLANPTLPLTAPWPHVSDPVHEAAGRDYELPGSTAYNETCAQIGNVLWNWRMLGINAQARHADVMERCLYNSILSGIGLDGASWFYTNVLRWYGPDHPLLSNDAYERFQPGLRHICCPSNLLRTIAGLRGYLYSVSDEGLWVNLYAANRFDGRLLDGSRVRLTQHTNYPWEGRVTLTMEETPAQRFALRLRIPGWADGAAIGVRGSNGQRSEVQAEPGTYACLDRTWVGGDVIELDLPMRVCLIEGHPRIEAVRNQVAVMRGPLVYCLESPDLPQGVHVSEVYLSHDVQLSPRHDPDLLGGITVLDGEAHVIKEGNWSGQLYRALRPAGRETQPITLIPYYTWANRGTSDMTVWMPLSSRA